MPMRSARDPLLLQLASARDLASLLGRAVGGLAAEPGTALARIWLLDARPGARSLSLAASAGRPRSERGDWSRLDGAFRRFRVGSGKIGRAAASAAAVAVRDVQRSQRQLSRPDWARREGIHGFAALPLLDGARTLGVLGVFRREPLDDAGLAWLSDVAAHATAGLVRARAFGALALRAEALERESVWLREALSTERSLASVPKAEAPLQEDQMRSLVRENVRQALARAGGRIYGAGGAAELLGVPPTTLAYRIRKLGLAPPQSGRGTR
jgi:transcriptional regulator with GAF, ATPase, and Fis domain